MTRLILLAALVLVSQPASARTYTAAEVGQMRTDVEMLGVHWTCDKYGPQGTGSIMAADIEPRLQTYLIAGIEPADLHAQAKKHEPDCDLARRSMNYDCTKVRCADGAEALGGSTFAKLRTQPSERDVPDSLFP